MQTTAKVKDIDRARFEELLTIKKDQGGILPPREVVIFAKNPETALHSWKGWKGWNESKAAEAFYLIQARHLIHTTVTVQYIKGVSQQVQVFTSLIGDRYRAGGGYREVVEVLSDSSLKNQFLETAVFELKGFQKKYERISELCRAVGDVVKKFERKIGK